MKRIIICSDGTWDRPGITDRGKPVKSNVELFYNSIKHGDQSNGKITRQVKYYDSGVGSSTYDFWDKLLGGIEGFGIDKNIKDLYTFIILNYEPGDEIYFFGFSRGAYTVRSLAGFIRNCGILKHEYFYLIDKAYELYRDRNDYSIPNSDLMKSFRLKYCVEDISPIHFIGVWDTVGSLGLPINKKYNLEKYRFHDVKLSSYIRNAYHAIAMDEQRSLFEPTLWEIDPNNHMEQKVEQRWFVGVHCNVGGGYVDTKLSDIALQWIHDKAQQTGLNLEKLELLDDHNYCFSPSYRGELRDSRTLPYKILPTKRRDYQLANKRKSNTGNPIITNEVIDDTVYQRVQDPALNYEPF